MWFTRESGFPQPHQVPAAFACPRALPGNIPVIADSLDSDCEEMTLSNPRTVLHPSSAGWQEEWQEIRLP